MARPEKPIDYTVPEVGDLAGYLRGLREAAGLTYAQLADRAWFSESSLKRAACGGSAVPRWDVVYAYAGACGSAEGEARMWHDRAKAAAAAAARDARRSTIAPKPQFARDLADLSGAMRDAYRMAGRPHIREMERHAGPGRLPRNTAHSIIKGRALPKEVRTYIAFLEECEITGRDLLPWFAAWARVRRVSDKQPVFLLSAPLPGEKLFIEWFAKAQEAASAQDAVVLTVVDGQQRLSALTELIKTPGGEVGIAA
ncbi:helix-turn-helix domain-containing protein [Streptomyces sp. NPDC001975]